MRVRVSPLCRYVKAWDEMGYVMGADASVSCNGDIGGHAYGLLKFVEVPEEDMRMVLIRNPHARNEWGGNFCDGDEDSWNAHPATMEACEHTIGNKDDGQYWMTLADFTDHFSAVCVNFQACVDQAGNPMPRFNEIEEGHEFTEYEIDVEGHVWPINPDGETLFI